MNCPRCNTPNNLDAKFCIRCGNPISNMAGNNSQFQPGMAIQQPISNINFQQQYQQVQQPGINQNVSQVSMVNGQGSVPLGNPSSKTSLSAYIFVILAVLLKPFTAFKQELEKFKEVKNSVFVSLMVTIFSTVVSLLFKIYNTVRVFSFDYDEGKKVTWVWDNLKKFDFVKQIGTDFLLYFGIILAIAFVYYMASLIVKKQVNFSKIWGIAAISVVPFLLCSLVLSPLLSLIYLPLAMAIKIVGGVYTLVILYETINQELLLEGNTKIYFNSICLALLGIIIYFISLKFTASVNVEGEVNDWLNEFWK